jgi:hypothetical protein
MIAQTTHTFFAAENTVIRTIKPLSLRVKCRLGASRNSQDEKSRNQFDQSRPEPPLDEVSD